MFRNPNPRILSSRTVSIGRFVSIGASFVTGSFGATFCMDEEDVDDNDVELSTRIRFCQYNALRNQRMEIPSDFLSRDSSTNNYSSLTEIYSDAINQMLSDLKSTRTQSIKDASNVANKRHERNEIANEETFSIISQINVKFGMNKKDAILDTKMFLKRMNVTKPSDLPPDFYAKLHPGIKAENVDLGDCTKGFEMPPSGFFPFSIRESSYSSSNFASSTSNNASSSSNIASSTVAPSHKRDRSESDEESMFSKLKDRRKRSEGIDRVKPRNGKQCEECKCLNVSRATGCCIVCRNGYSFKQYRKRRDVDGDKIEEEKKDDDENKCKCYNCGYAAGSSSSRDILDEERLETEMKHLLTFVNFQDRKLYVKQRIEASITKATINMEKFGYDHSVGRPGLVVRCCSNGFNNFYGISNRTKSRRNVEIKGMKSSRSKLDSTLSGSYYEGKQFENEVKDKYGLVLNDSEKCVIRMKESKSRYSTMNSVDECTAWLELYFETGAEEQPNRFNQRHLRQATITKKILWEKYEKEIKSRNDSPPPLNYNQFCKVWRQGFDNVKVQKFVAVQTKCHTCSYLDMLAEKAGNNKVLLGELRMFRVLHSSFYRAQRKWYHGARELAIQDRGNYLSGIGDGMAQAHNVLPSYSKSGSQVASKTFDTHFQGFITHGVSFTIFRSFGNVGKGNNIALHAWLTHLEREFLERKRQGFSTLQDTIYYEIDGGSENANNVTLAAAEMLIAWGLTKKIVITRLPPGHTHEDIDGQFGVIWQHNWRKNIITPQDQKKYTIGAFQKSIDRGRKVDMVDVFAVPDYRAYFKPHTDVSRGFQSDGYRTLGQLQWTLTRTEKSVYFPNGVKTVYRAYPTDEAVEIVLKKHIPFKYRTATKTLSGLVPIRVLVVDRPTSEDNKGGPAGMRVLETVPVGPLRVAAFKKLKVKDNSTKTVVKVDIFKYLEDVVCKIGEKHGIESEQYKEWVAFMEAFPSGSAEEYVRSKGNNYHVPFKEFFEGTAEELKGRTSSADIGADNMMSDILVAETQASVSWGTKSRGFREHPCLPFAEPRKIINWQEHELSGPYLVSSKPSAPSEVCGKDDWRMNDIAKWTVEQLKAELRSRFLPTDGLKDVLVQRMLVDDRKMGGDPEFLSEEEHQENLAYVKLLSTNQDESILTTEKVLCNRYEGQTVPMLKQLIKNKGITTSLIGKKKDELKTMLVDFDSKEGSSSSSSDIAPQPISSSGISSSLSSSSEVEPQSRSSSGNWGGFAVGAGLGKGIVVRNGGGLAGGLSGGLGGGLHSPRILGDRSDGIASVSGEVLRKQWGSGHIEWNGFPIGAGLANGIVLRNGGGLGGGLSGGTMGGLHLINAPETPSQSHMRWLSGSIDALRNKSALDDENDDNDLDPDRIQFEELERMKTEEEEDGDCYDKMGHEDDTCVQYYNEFKEELHQEVDDEECEALMCIEEDGESDCE